MRTCLVHGHCINGGPPGFALRKYLQLIYFNILLYHQVILELRLKWRSLLCKETIKASISECPSLRALNLVPFSAQKLSNYLAAVNEFKKLTVCSVKFKSLQDSVWGLSLWFWAILFAQVTQILHWLFSF